MTAHLDRGTSTAEYAVGTLGACTMALVLYRLCVDGYFLEQLGEIIRQALQWRDILDHLHRPGMPLGRR